MWNLEKLNSEWWLAGAEGWGKWGDVGLRGQTSSYKMNKFWELMYSMVTNGNSTVFYT